MTQQLEQAILRAEALSKSAQDHLASLMLSVIEKAEQEAPLSASSPTVWDLAARTSSLLPEKEWRAVPADGAAEHDHYLYGSAKRH